MGAKIGLLRARWRVLTTGLALATALGSAGTLLLAGCTARTAATGGPAAPSAATNNGAGSSTRCRVVAEATPFYRLGPQQSGGPDLSLKRDTRLALLKRTLGYSQVRLEDGQTGLVGSEDIRPLSPQELAAEAAPPPGSSLVPGRSPLFGSNNTTRRPRFRGPALPIPPDAQEPSLPTSESSPTPRPGPTPAFRL